MKYYLANLALHLLVTLLLGLVVVIFADRNRKRKTKYPVSYFIPTVAAIIVATYAFHVAGPRLLDLSDVATQNYYSYTGVIEEIALFNNSLVIDGETYYINPMRDLPGEGSKVRIRYTRYSNYVISVEAVDTVDVSGAISEELETAVDIPV